MPGMITEYQQKSGEPISLNALFVLNALKRNRRMSAEEIGKSLYLPEAKLRATLERLTEAGLIEAIGSNRGRTYVLSAKMYHDPVKYRSFQGRQENESPATAVRQPEPQVNGCLVTAIADRGKLNID